MPGLAVLTEEEKASIRHHLGFMQVAPSTSIFMGFPAATQTSFLVETAMDHIMEAGVGRIRDDIAECDRIECEIKGARFRLQAKSVEGIDLNPQELTQLKTEYTDWAKRLADDLGVPINAYAAKFQYTGGPMPLNMHVVQ